LVTLEFKSFKALDITNSFSSICFSNFPAKVSKLSPAAKAKAFPVRADV